MRTPAIRRRRAPRAGLGRGSGDSAQDAPEPAAAPIGHNRPPAEPGTLPAGASCTRCHHWRAPSPRDVRDFESFQNGVTKRRVKEPAGTCDRILHHPSSRPAFGSCLGRSSCFNFTPDTRTKPQQDRRGFVTIYEGGRIVWQGTEGDEPAHYRQSELDL